MVSILTIIRQRRQRRQLHGKTSKGRIRRWIVGIGFIVSALMMVILLVAVLAYASLTVGLTPLNQMSVLLDPQDGQLLQPTRIYDHTGQHLIASLSSSDSPRIYVPYNQFPQALVEATVILNQPGFWSSPGYSTRDWRNPQAHATLAQQLVSELLLWDQPPSTLRAIHERILAAQLTARYGRLQIMEWYLNSADYGHYAYGAEAAAQLYFGKSVTRLGASQAAMLAAVSQAPALNPIDAPLAAEQRRVQTLMVMQGLGLLTGEQAASAISTPPSQLAEVAPVAQSGSVGIGTGGQLAPAFVNLVVAQLESHFGGGRIARGGLVILTSLDYDLQLQVVCTVRTYLARLAGDSNEIPAADGSPCQSADMLPSLQPGESLPGASASAVIVDPQSGQILAAVEDVSGNQQGSLFASHPAGTSITPFIYLTGLSRGLSPATLTWDIPSGNLQPGEVYHGPVRLRTALANDYLAPAQSVLFQMGLQSVQDISASLGLNLPAGLLSNDFDLSPLALAAAYEVFADNGNQVRSDLASSAVRLVTVLQVSGVDHAIWADWTTPHSQSLLSPQLAYLVNQILSDETARWPSQGHPNPLEIGRPAAVKLSRTLDSSGAWTIGYTPQREVVVFLKGASPLVELVQPRYSADLWHTLIQYSVRDLPSSSWDMPPGIVTVSVCDPSGMLPTAICPEVVSEVFLEGRQPVQVDTLFQSFPVNLETGLLATVFTPPELITMHTYMIVPPQAVQWAKNTGIAIPPTSYDTLQVPSSMPDVHITSPVMFDDEHGTIRILGSAKGEDFQSYRLEYGQGLYPLAWVQIGTDTTTPHTESLLGEWDTTGLDGLYALRLMVVHDDQRVEQAVVQVTLDNTPPQVAITYPTIGQELSLVGEPLVALLAQVSDPFLVKVDFYVDDALVGESQVAPYGVVWQAQVGRHTLQVVATDRAGNTADTSIDFTVR